MSPVFMHHIQDTLLFNHLIVDISYTGLSPSWVVRSSTLLQNIRQLNDGVHIGTYISVSPSDRRLPFSVALTHGISIDFFSCGY